MASVPTEGSTKETTKTSLWLALALSALLLGTLFLRLLWLDKPAGALIFDEVYYVNAARVILGWPVPEGAHYYGAPIGIDPNSEHLPLAKLVIAVSMRLFGDNAVGWRLPSVLMGTGAVGLLFLLLRRLSGRAGLALFAAFVFSLDNLAFVHSRIATLDIQMVFFMLLGLYLYVAGRAVLAGAALALAVMSKLTGVYGVGAIAGYEVLRLLPQPQARAAWRDIAGNLALMLGVGLVFFLLVLWPIDRQWTAFPDPLRHVAHVLQYGVNMTSDRYPSTIESAPWQWLVNQEPIVYLKVSNDVRVDGKLVQSQPVVDFQGEMNPYVIFLAPLVLAYLLVRAVTTRESLPLFLLALAGATYLPSVLTATLDHRASYIYYFLPVLPALCAGIAYLMLDRRLPRYLPVAYALGVVFGFAMLFPFRAIP